MNSAINQSQLAKKLKIRTDKTGARSVKSSINTPETPYSPISPSTSPTSEAVDSLSLEPDYPITNGKLIKPKYSLQSSLISKGYVPISQLSKTLQGSIWKVASNNGTGSKYIVKVTSKALHKQSIAYYKGRKVSVDENILKEINILHHLTVKCRHPPKSLIKYRDSFHDKHNYFLVIEDGGFPLFDFIKDCHQYIKKGIIDIPEWHKFCKRAMKQMVNVMNWLHTKANCVHLDISLENFTIKNIRSTIVMNGKQKKIIFSSDFQIKLIDFGLAEVFGCNESGYVDFRCSKFVGKQPYQSPEVLKKKKGFNSASSDVWALAVCFFMMFFGGQPFGQATMDDVVYQLVMKGQLLDVLDSWGVIRYASAEILHLLNQLFRAEKDRLTIAEVKQHCFFK